MKKKNCIRTYTKQARGNSNYLEHTHGPVALRSLLTFSDINVAF